MLGFWIWCPYTLRWEVQNFPSLYDLVRLIKRMLGVHEMGMNGNKQKQLPNQAFTYCPLRHPPP